MKAISNVKHESSKIDIAQSFVLGYPDYIIELDYYANLDGYRPDIVVRMTSPDLAKYHTFLVEIERKAHPRRTINETIKKAESVLGRLDYKRYRLSPHTKVLVVWNNMQFDPLLRPMQYGEQPHSGRLAFLETQFETLLKQCKMMHLLNSRYRFIPFSEFTGVHKPIWRTIDGGRVALIE